MGTIKKGRALSKAREELRTIKSWAKAQHKADGEAIKKLERELFAEKTRRVTSFADAPRLVAWMQDSKRKPAAIAFTAGPERDVAREFECQMQKAFSTACPRCTHCIARGAFGLIDAGDPALKGT